MQEESFSSLDFNESDEENNFYSQSQLAIKKAQSVFQPINENLIKENQTGAKRKRGNEISSVYQGVIRDGWFSTEVKQTLNKHVNYSEKAHETAGKPVLNRLDGNDLHCHEILQTPSQSKPKQQNFCGRSSHADRNFQESDKQNDNDESFSISTFNDPFEVMSEIRQEKDDTKMFSQ